MTNRNTTLATIPVLVSLILIPQLFFFWLAPASAVAKTVVYCIGTGLTIASALTVVITYSLYGLRRSMGTAAAAVALELAAIAVCTVLLILDATIRTAAFALSITALVFLACLMPMVLSAAANDRQGHSTSQRRPGPPPALPRRNR